MTEIFSVEIVNTAVIVGSSALVTIMGFLMMRIPESYCHEVDIDAAVRDAPYHLLEEAGVNIEGVASAK